MLDAMCGVTVVSSPTGGAGVTSVLLSLAAVLAQEGRRVVVVDGTSSGALTRLLGVELGEAAGGLLRALERPEAVEHFLLETGYPGLRLLPADVQTVGDQTRLHGALGEPGFARLLERLSSLAEVVLVDGPSAFSPAGQAVLAAGERVLLVLQPQPLAVRLLPELLGCLQGEARKLTVEICLNAAQGEAPFFGPLTDFLWGHFGPLMLRTALPVDAWFVEAAARAMPLPCLMPEAPAAQATVRLVEEMRARAR